MLIKIILRSLIDRNRFLIIVINVDNNIDETGYIKFIDFDMKVLDDENYKTSVEKMLNPYFNGIQFNEKLLKEVATFTIPANSQNRSKSALANCNKNFIEPTEITKLLIDSKDALCALNAEMIVELHRTSKPNNINKQFVEVYTWFNDDFEDWDEALKIHVSTLLEVFSFYTDILNDTMFDTKQYVQTNLQKVSAIVSTIYLSFTLYESLKSFLTRNEPNLDIEIISVQTQIFFETFKTSEIKTEINNIKKDIVSADFSIMSKAINGQIKSDCKIENGQMDEHYPSIELMRYLCQHYVYAHETITFNVVNKVLTEFRQPIKDIAFLNEPCIMFFVGFRVNRVKNSENFTFVFGVITIFKIHFNDRSADEEFETCAKNAHLKSLRIIKKLSVHFNELPKGCYYYAGQKKMDKSLGFVITSWEMSKESFSLLFETLKHAKVVPNSNSLIVTKRLPSASNSSALSLPTVTARERMQRICHFCLSL